MNKKQLQTILSNGEGQFIEFKEKADKNLAKEFVAFANSSGGKIFIGISDNSTIKGIKITNELKSQIYNTARTCEPAIKIDIEDFENILIVNIPQGKSKPYSCSEGFYVRMGTNCQQLKREEIIQLAIQSKETSFDRIVNENSSLKDIDKPFFKSFVKQYIGNIPADNNLLESLELAKGEHLTNADILLFSKNPNKFFKYTYTDCVLLKGTDRTNILDRKTFSGNLFSQLDGAMTF